MWIKLDMKWTWATKWTFQNLEMLKRKIKEYVFYQSYYILSISKEKMLKISLNVLRGKGTSISFRALYLEGCRIRNAYCRSWEQYLNEGDELSFLF